ncbi:DUF1129 domain-containing protein [Lactococcus formosensis]|jgi:uncharacterized membrane-anchored protein|uniref:DUF1129 family protein n=1 Tax=Lactococcus formosensis TaxID=1281486 RepID=A0A9Q8Y2U4_9LACT|nr:DUF1129 family protein [Lactococcus formosensis]NHI67202.1 DUF1129 family protein [Lactococcus garvieae]MCH1722612.1 DUF1129 family protein [Lactococcus formosensis]MCO7179942.1 DUF1129 family protein [Lactococcus formosensis]MDG6114804.1 DUF1129 family protein [Lactococcus formosensis]MDG6118950.1 DUF1129 family protein [Lactococcus formosensis]
MENLIEQLTAKNSEYVHNVTKQLMLLGKSDEEIKTILAEILPKIIEGQKEGILARKLLGAPMEFATQYKPEEDKVKRQETAKNESPFLMWLDSALLFFGVISVVMGLMGLFQPQASVYGLLTTLASSALAGLVMYWMYKYFYSAQRPQKKGKGFAMLAVAMVAWAGVSVLVALLPKSINIVLAPYLTIILGAAVMGIRFLIQRKFNVQSSMARQTK